MLYFLEEIGSDLNCENSKIFPLFQAAKFVIVVIQIAVPFALVIWGSLDFFKALIAADEKEMRMRRRPFISRLVAAIVILILPWLVQLIAKQIVGSDTNSYWTCFWNAHAVIDFSSWNTSGTTTTGEDTKGKNNYPKDNQGIVPKTCEQLGPNCNNRKQDDYGKSCKPVSGGCTYNR